LVLVSIAFSAFAAEQATTDTGTIDERSARQAFPTKPPYSPYAGRSFPTRPFFGDTHDHTSFSIDVRRFGCRFGPRGADRFGRGGGDGFKRRRGRLADRMNSQLFLHESVSTIYEVQITSSHFQ
jgi:hypothetical protein